MAWEKVREHIDEALGRHTVFLEDNSATPPAKHQLIIDLGPDCCPHCGHVQPKTNLGELDPKAIVAAELVALENAMRQKRAYRLKHRIPGKK